MSEETLTVRVPLAVRKRGGRKVVVAPDQAITVPQREPANWTLVKNLARAFRWQRMLESGEYATIAELAKKQRVTDSYVGRILKLALISPHDVDEIVGMIQGSGWAGISTPHAGGIDEAAYWVWPKRAPFSNQLV